MPLISMRPIVTVTLGAGSRWAAGEALPAQLATAPCSHVKRAPQKQVKRAAWVGPRRRARSRRVQVAFGSAPVSVPSRAAGLLLVRTAGSHAGKLEKRPYCSPRRSAELAVKQLRPQPVHRLQWPAPRFETAPPRERVRRRQHSPSGLHGRVGHALERAPAQVQQEKRLRPRAAARGRRRSSRATRDAWSSA